MLSFIEVATTVKKREDAVALAQMVIEKRLAACVHISESFSMYRWNDQIETAEEIVCVMKTRENLFAPLCKSILSHHPYEVPEVIARPIIDGNKEYLAWLDSELQST